MCLFLLQSEDEGAIETSRTNQTGTHVKTDCGIIKLKELSSKTEKIYELHGLNSNHSSSNSSAIHVANLETPNHTIHKQLNTYQCESDDCSTKQVGNLMRHTNVILKGSKPYQCDVCDYSASHACILRTHISAVHERFKPFSVKCAIIQLHMHII